MSKKIFFTDLDKTLLNSEKKITPATREALQAFADAGNLVVPCTGRPTGSLWNAYYNLGLEPFCRYIVSFNGGEIVDMKEKKILFRTHLTEDQVRESEKLAKKFGIYSQTFTDTHIITAKMSECTDRFRKYEYMPVIESDDILKPMGGILPCKILYIELHDFDRFSALEKALKEHFGNTAEVCYSDPIYLELMPKDAGKGNGIKKFCELMGVPIENTIAAGDEGNDIPMVKAAGCGVAMKNGIDAIKEAADIITPYDNDHDGLVPILKQFT